VNGRILPTTTLTVPTGTPPSFSGTGYIGNSAAANRNWVGLLEDIRIYDRILSPAEVQVLASVPPTNLAPAVFAGTNQIVVWPGSVDLAGTVSDDGNPNPPGAVALAWSQVSGPGAAAFARTNAAATAVSFSSAGNYVLQLAADDGQARTAGNVSIAAVIQPTVQAAFQAGSLQLSWDTSVPGWYLQAQTNSLGSGLGTNWVNVPGSDGTNQWAIPIVPAGPTVFYRLASPY
jgi:hypothetical protein